MEFLNSSFIFITDKIIELQAYFLMVARWIALVAITVTVCMTAFNYAMLGTGLKENVIKVTKAVLFFTIVMYAYPSIVGWITNFTFETARNSTLPSMQAYLQTMQTGIQEESMRQLMDNESPTYGGMALQQAGGTAASFFGQGIIQHRTFTTTGGRTFNYSTVAPKAALAAVLLVAGECLNFATHTTARGIGRLQVNVPNIGNAIIGIFCAFLVIFVGIMAVFEYLIAFIEFMFIASVGVILFPLSLYEGTKGYSDSFIKAMIGHFIKLLFCTIVIFFVLYGFLALSTTFVASSFMGTADQVMMVVATSLLFLFIAKAAPALASSLITGSPSLTGGSAIRTVTSAVAAAGAVGAMGFKGAALAGRGAGTVADKVGSGLLQAGGAASSAMKGAQHLGGNVGMLGMKTFAGSVGGQLVAPIKKAGADLCGSLKTGWNSRVSKGAEYGNQQADFYNRSNPIFAQSGMVSPYSKDGPVKVQVVNPAGSGASASKVMPQKQDAANIMQGKKSGSSGDKKST